MRLLQRLRADGQVDVFDPNRAEELLALPEAALAVKHIESLGLVDPADVLRLCLQSLEVQHSELAVRTVPAEFVATLPSGSAGVARSTREVVGEMLAAAAEEVVLLGFELTDTRMIEHLANAARRGASVVVICDRERGVPQRVQAAWPSDCPTPRLYQDRRRRNPGPYSSMHAKCLLVDGTDLLITSANFTFHGLHENIEMGVRLKGEQAGQARLIFNHLVTSDAIEEVI